jgi:hypothetical protein
MQVQGIVVARHLLVDGRPSQSRAEIAEMVAAFEPGSVGILSRHGGLAIGSVETLTAEGGRDLRFTGFVVDYPDLVERLRHRAVGISVEIARPRAPRWDGRPEPGTELVMTAAPHFRGTLGIGATLIGIALSDNPAAAGSVLWRVPEAEVSTT